MKPPFIRCGFTADANPRLNREEVFLCEEAASLGDKFCIFHSRSIQKRSEPIRERLEQRIALTSEGEILRLDGSIFPADLSFTGIEFACGVSFCDAEFHGQEIDFSETKFASRAWFCKAAFHGKVSFSRSEFSKGADFKSAMFHGTDFKSAMFHDDVNFFEAQSEIETDFSSVEFRGAADFSCMKFAGPALFYKAVFQGKVSFEYSELPEGASFLAAMFHGDARFWYAKFGEAQADISTDFSSVEFHGNVDFRKAKFQGRSTSFGSAIFYGSARFWATEFVARKTDFFSARFDNQAHFFICSITGTIDFTFVTLEKEAELRFQMVDLPKASFRDVDLRHARFLDVTWNRSTRWREGRWRSRVYDEEVWRRGHEKGTSEKELLDCLARNYRDLKYCYRSAGESPLVGHFHYGLMEVQLYQRGIDLIPDKSARLVQRISLFVQRWSKRLFSWDVLYRLSSGYGEDYAWTALITCLFILFCAFAYFAQTIPQMTPPERIIYLANGTALPVQTYVPLKQQALAALLYSLQVGSLGRVHYYADPSQWPVIAELVYTFESFIVPIQVVFFAVALRNRFRR